MEQFNSSIVVQRDENGAAVEVSSPVMIVYPHNRSSDFVQEWNENLFIRDLLEMLFKESQKDDDLYNLRELGNMCVYVKTNDVFDTFKKQEWIRVKLSNTLGECMNIHKDYIIPIIPVLFVFHVSWKNTFFGKEVQSMYGTPAHRIDHEH